MIMLLIIIMLVIAIVVMGPHMGNQRATNQKVFIPTKMGRRRGPGSKFKPKPNNTHMGNQRATDPLRATVPYLWLHIASQPEF